MPIISIRIDGCKWQMAADPQVLVEKAVASATATALLDYPANAELSVLVTSDTAIAALNRQWRGHDGATNVLSFPAETIHPNNAGRINGLVLGDIVVAKETVRREAAQSTITFEAHFTHMIIHGYLHLFGYDHIKDDDAAVMEQIEVAALADLGIADPYHGERSPDYNNEHK